MKSVFELAGLRPRPLHQSLLATSAQPNSRVRDSSRLAAFTVVPITANSSRFKPISPSTTGP